MFNLKRIMIETVLIQPAAQDGLISFSLYLLLRSYLYFFSYVAFKS